MKSLVRFLGVCTLFAGLCAVIYATTFSDTYDTATPLGSDAPSVIDDRIREVKAAVQERANVDHYWPLTGTQVSDADSGEHRKITFNAPLGADPTNVADKGFVYMKDVSGVVELFWEDESGNVLQLSTGGKLSITSTDLLATLANDTYFTAIDNAGTGTVDLIKANTSDVAVLPDGTETATSGAPTADADIANKKYVDDGDTALQAGITWGSLTGVDSEGNSFLKAHAYLAAQNGMVHVYADLESGETIKGYNDNSSDPAGAGTQMVISEGQDLTDHFMSVTFTVASGRYFEITSDVTPTIVWQAMESTGGAPVDQD